MEYRKLDEIKWRDFYYKNGDLQYIFSIPYNLVVENIEIAERNARSLGQINSIFETKNITLICSEEQYAEFYNNICHIVSARINEARRRNPNVSETKIFSANNVPPWESRIRRD